jgi:transposase
MRNERKHYTEPEADGILRWQKEFFENGAAVFQAQERLHRQVEEKQKRIEFLEKKVQAKDEVLAELMAEHITLKKHLGNSNRQLGAA